ncbi:MAG: hypothetical protein IPK32_26240 [Verrucomicrobiaceae bacterium]|nr:hypothetical protein [Verrucomicrobiaceae bacterium]MBK8095375.1 hypothetical protein [Verrucomicrobiaceae bacterium]
MKRLLFSLLLATALRAEPVPDKLVVLTFDDSVACLPRSSSRMGFGFLLEKTIA